MNTIIEKIRTWVERQLKNTHDWLNGKGAKKGTPRYYEMRGRESAFDSVLSILSDLEKSNSKDFPTTDEEMAKFLATHPKVELPEKYKTPDLMFEKSKKPSEGLEEECLNPFKLVAECIDDTLKEKAKEVSANEIEDEINRWMGSTDCLPEDVGITPLPKVMEIVERTARHFAKWQKVQLMKEAVVGVFLNNPYPTICLDDCVDYDFKDNQEIRFIIVKEEKNGTK